MNSKRVNSIILIIGFVLLDFVSKILVRKYLMPMQKTVDIIPKIIGFTYVENRGAAFGMFSDKRYIFMIISVIYIIALLIFLLKTKLNHPLFVISMSMIVGGGIGNMIDRTVLGYVIDFIEFRFVDFAVFNVADSFVCIGAALAIIYFVFIDKTFFKDNKSEISDAK